MTVRPMSEFPWDAWAESFRPAFDVAYQNAPTLFLTKRQVEAIAAEMVRLGRELTDKEREQIAASNPPS